MIRTWIPAVALASLECASACGTGRVAPARAQHAPLTGVLRDGEIAFMHFCDHCHPGGAAGLGPSLNDKPLPRGAIALQIRRGLGVMPPFPERVIDEPTLDAITRYTVWLSDLEPADES